MSNAKRSVIPLLFASLAASAPSSVLAQAKYGPEIELNGKNHVANMTCYIGGVPSVLTAIGGAAATNYEHDVAPVVASAAGAAAVTCVTRYFTHSDAKVSDRYLQKIAAEYARLPSGQVRVDWVEDEKNGRRALQVTYPNGHEITFGVDQNTIEVRTSPATAREINSNAEFYQREIFDRAERAGLKAPTIDSPMNGGHIHVDVHGGFDGDPKNLKNFVFDYVEHGELSGGVLVKDGLNAKPISLKKNRSDLVRLGAYLDQMSAKGETLTRAHLEKIKKDFPNLFGRSSALNINPRLGTLEIRGNRSPKNAMIYADTVDLLDGRIQYTNSQPSMKVPDSDGLDAKSTWGSRFRQYVEEAGRDYDKYKFLAPTKYQMPSGSTAKAANPPSTGGNSAAGTALSTCVKNGLKDALKLD